MMLYPNQFSVDLMEEGGRPPSPFGMLRVKLNRIENLKKGDAPAKVDVYCLLEVFFKKNSIQYFAKGSSRTCVEKQDCKGGSRVQI